MNNQNTTPAGDTTTDTSAQTALTQAIKPVKTVSEIEKLVIGALTVMFPYYKKVLVDILQNEELGAARAYVLSDLPAVMAGERMNGIQLAKRVEVAGHRKALLGLAGKIRGEFSTPLHNKFALATAEPANEADDSEALSALEKAMQG